MKGCPILFHNTPHAPSLRSPLYYTHRPHTQPVCEYYDDDTVDNLLLFTKMVIDVEYVTENIVSFRLISCTLRDRKIDYVEPRPASA